MSEDYSDRIRALLPDDVLGRYLELRDAISARRQELWDLREELVEIARTYGVPDIDHAASGSNERIRASLGAVGIEINSIWASAPEAWECPCCGRAKPQCARLGTKGQMIGKLVAHHDHFEDLMDVVLTDLSKDTMIEAASSADARRFIRRGLELFTRFDRIIICEDCNNAEANGKALTGADRYLTFTPAEIAKFIRPAANCPHDVDKAALAAVFRSAKRHYDVRSASIGKLADSALKGTSWFEPVALEDRDEQVERVAQLTLRSFGLDHVGYGTVRDIFFPTQKIDAKHASAWRTKRQPSPRTPSETELEFVIRGHQLFGELPDDWACPCCGRPKRDIVRWSQNSKQFMFRVVPRNIADAKARYGTRQVRVCDACNHTFQECHKELRTRLGEHAVPDYPVGMDEIRLIIRPRPHGLHDVDSEAAELFVSSIVSALSGFE